MRANLWRLVASGGVIVACAVGAQAAADGRLIEAVKHRDAKAVSVLVKTLDVNARQPDRATALHWAANLDDLQIAGLLIAAGADVNAANDYGVTPLMLASENGSVGMIEILLKAGAHPNTALESGETAIMTAARSGNADAVTALAGRGANVNAIETEKGQTALMWATSEEHRDVVRTLLAHGADVRAKSRSGFTALMFAARQGDIETTRLLLDRGADLNAEAGDGTTALLVAAVRGHVPLAEFLLDHGANPNTRAAGYTPLHWASGRWEGVTSHDYLVEFGEWSALGGVPKGRLELIAALLTHGADPNARMTKSAPRYGFNLFQARVVSDATPFYLAALSGDVAVMRLLAAGGANPRLTAKDGTTPLMAAAGAAWVENESLIPERDRIAAVQLCQDLGVDINAANDAGNTALHSTILGEFNGVIQFLVDHGARLNAKNKSGSTALRMAEDPLAATRIRVRVATAKLLRQLGADTEGRPGPDVDTASANRATP